MRIVEIFGALIIGALLLGLGHELGKNSRAQAEKTSIDEKMLDAKIKQLVQLEVGRKEQLILRKVKEEIEKVLDDGYRYPEANKTLAALPEMINENDRIEELENELESLIANNSFTSAKSVEKSEPERRREPFDPSVLREFEEARRKMLEERRRKANENE